MLEQTNTVDRQVLCLYVYDTGWYERVVNAVGRGANVRGVCAGHGACGCWGADVVEERRRLRSMKRGHASRTTATRNLRSLLIHRTFLHLLLRLTTRLRPEFNHGSVTFTIKRSSYQNESKHVDMYDSCQEIFQMR